MQEVIIVAHIWAKQDKHIELKRELTLLAEQTQAEPRCIQFDLHQAEKEPRLFVLWERFENQSAFDEHMQQPHTKTYFEYIKSDLTESTEGIRLNQVLQN